MMLIDTHCHIHEADYPLDIPQTLQHAHDQGVKQLICVGTSEESSRQALAFAAKYPQAYASIGVHPHDTKDGWEGLAQLVRSVDTVHSGNGFAHVAAQLSSAAGVSSNEGMRHNSSSERPRLVAIGEIGLDYFYTHSSREVQIQALKWQIELALDHDLPIIFHVREAFDDFWPIFDSFKGIRGELHSFTDNQANLDAALARGLYIGVNGISTFTRDEAQQAVFASIPLDKLLLETDAPFLTPIPFRGKVNEPAFVKNIAEHHAAIRGVTPEEIASRTTANARALFAL